MLFILIILLVKFLSSWCGCGKTLTKGVRELGPEYCDFPCEGNVNQMCGSWLNFNVFKTCLYKNNLKI